jgi:hypothetical protein
MGRAGVGSSFQCFSVSEFQLFDFMLNNTLNNVLACRPISTMGFSGVTQTASIHLNGPGGQSAGGFPLPRHGYLTALHLWDGTTHHADSNEVEFMAGDRLSIFCQNSGADFTVKVRVNGSSVSLQCTGVPLNSTLYAVVEFVLIRE